jgi:hypothetical protein
MAENSENVRFRIPGSTLAIAEATNSSYNQPLPWVPLWQANSMDGVYTVKVWNPAGTNQSAAWPVRVIFPLKVGSTVAWGHNANHQAEHPIDLPKHPAVGVVAADSKKVWQVLAGRPLPRNRKVRIEHYPMNAA